MKSEGISVINIAPTHAFTLAAALAGASLLFAITTHPVTASEHGKKPASMDIVDTAIAAGDFKTLVTAVKAAGLVETLKGKGPFTVFAPNDAAFAKIPKNELDGRLKDKEALTKVLTYHVVAGKVMAADAAKLTSANTVEGQPLVIDASEGVKINDATVIKADIEASNGVIHVIDTVLMPPSPS